MREKVKECVQRKEEEAGLSRGITLAVQLRTRKVEKENCKLRYLFTKKAGDLQV